MQHNKKISKTLLRNVIHQTELHNRIVEEEECWRQYEALQSSSSVCRTDIELGQGSNSRRYQTVYKGSSRLRSKAYENSDNEGDVPPKKKCRAHMDDIDETRPQVYSDRCDAPRSNFWLRQLDAAESADPDRVAQVVATSRTSSDDVNTHSLMTLTSRRNSLWGHSGYKELYPQDFQTPYRHTSNTNSSSNSEADSEAHPKKSDKKKSKHRNRHKKKKKRKKSKRTRSSSESSPSESRHRTEYKKRKHKQHEHKKKKSKHCRS